MSSWSDTLAKAFAQRAELAADPGQTAYRLFHGYGEGHPGLTIDRYGDSVLVVDKRPDGELPDGLVDCLHGHAPFVRIGRKRQDRRSWDPQALDVEFVHGAAPEAPLDVLDHGLHYAVEPFARMNTGFFLDTRPLRGWLRGNSEGRSVLNLFAYTGSLGVAAMAGGARRVVHVDQKRPPLQRARENHARNGQQLDERAFVCGNIYAHLPRAARAGQRFDGIILDPPPQLPRKRGKPRPRNQDYPGLIPPVCDLLADGAWLVCSFHRYERSTASYVEEISTAAQGRLALDELVTSGSDFPETDPEQKLRIGIFRRT